MDTNSVAFGNLDKSIFPEWDTTPQLQRRLFREGYKINYINELLRTPATSILIIVAIIGLIGVIYQANVNK